MAIAFSNLDEHGQTTVPAEICQKLGIRGPEDERTFYAAFKGARSA